MFIACASLQKQLFVSDSVTAAPLVFHVAEVGALWILFQLSFDTRYLSIDICTLFRPSRRMIVKCPGIGHCQLFRLSLCVVIHNQSSINTIVCSSVAA
jgi:hypothetical protein